MTAAQNIYSFLAGPTILRQKLKNAYRTLEKVEEPKPKAPLIIEPIGDVRINVYIEQIQPMQVDIRA